MSSMSFGSQPSLAKPSFEGAVLGIDVGMTATRASIVAFKMAGKTDLNPDSVPRPDTPEADLYNECDFPATAYPFQFNTPAAQCLGYPVSQRTDLFPLKMYCYFVHMRKIARDGHHERVSKIRRDIVQLGTIWRRIQERSPAYQQKVATRLKDIFIEHLKIVRECSDNKADGMGLCITKLAVTIPPNWVKFMQDTYLELLMEVWGDIGEENIEFIYESEALGHWLLRLNTSRRKYESTSRLLLADFGGHTLNTACFAIVRQSLGGNFAFFTYQEADCHHGGSELHISDLKSEIETQIHARNLALTPKEKAYLLDTCLSEYHFKRRAIIDGKPFHVEGKTADRHGVHIEIDIDAERARDMFKKSFHRPLANLAEHVRRSKPEGETDVVLSGGSFKNRVVRDKAKSDIEKAGLSSMSWIEEMKPPNSQSSIISQGAALAVVNTLTVTQYVRQCAFAIDYGKNQSSSLPIILSGQGSHPLTFDFPGFQGDKLSLHCAPLVVDESSLTVPRENTYEFHFFGVQSRGLYEIRMRHELSATRGDRMIVELKRLSPEKGPQPGFVDWPVFYDPGSCVCFIDHDKLYEEQSMGSRGTESELSSGRPNRKRTKYHRDWMSQQRQGGTSYWAPPVERDGLNPTAPVSDMTTEAPRDVGASSRASRPTRASRRLAASSSARNRAEEEIDEEYVPVVSDVVPEGTDRELTEHPNQLPPDSTEFKYPESHAALPAVPQLSGRSTTGSTATRQELHLSPDGLPGDEFPISTPINDCWSKNPSLSEVVISQVLEFTPDDQQASSGGKRRSEAQLMHSSKRRGLDRTTPHSSQPANAPLVSETRSLQSETTAAVNTPSQHSGGVSFPRMV